MFIPGWESHHPFPRDRRRWESRGKVLALEGSWPDLNLGRHFPAGQLWDKNLTSLDFILFTYVTCTITLPASEGRLKVKQGIEEVPGTQQTFLKNSYSCWFYYFIICKHPALDMLKQNYLPSEGIFFSLSG